MLTIEAPERGQLTLDYFDTSGRLRQTETMELPAGQFELPLQLPAAGFWYCRLTLNGQSQLYVQQLRLIVID